MNQEDWYLHEGPPAPAPVGVTEVQSRVAACYSGSATLTIANTFAGARVDDYVIVAMYPSQQSSASVHWMSVDGCLEWIAYLPTAVGLGNQVAYGPQIVWAGGFVRSAGETMVFRRITAKTDKEFCIRAWCWRGLSKMANGANYPYLSAGSSKRSQALTSISYSAYTAGQYTCLPPASPGRGAIQYTYGASGRERGSATDSPTFWWGATKYGPTPREIESFTFTMGAVYYNEIILDDITTGAFSEITSTPLDATVAGGFKTWSKVGNMATCSWVAANSVFECRTLFKGSTPAGSGTGVHMYSQKFVPTVGLEHLVWCCLGTQGTTTEDMYFSVTNPIGGERGVMCFAADTNGYYFGPPYDGGFDKYLNMRPDIDGVGSRIVGAFCGIFTPSLSGTHVFNVFCAPSWTDRQTKADGHIGVAAGVNPANKSVLTPYVNLLLDDRYAIGRAWIHDNVDHTKMTDAGGLDADRYMGSFMLCPALNGVPTMRLVPISNWLWSPSSTYVRGDMDARKSVYNDEDNGHLTTDRVIFPKRYETSATYTKTLGHYYAEISLGTQSATTAWEIGWCTALYGGEDGHRKGGTITETVTYLRSTTNQTFNLQYTMSYSQVWTLAAGNVVGLEWLWDEGNYLKVRLYKDGSLIHAHKIRNGRDSVNFAPHTQPARLWIYPANNLMTVNVTGPFAHKPANAVAYDYANEVP